MTAGGPIAEGVLALELASSGDQAPGQEVHLLPAGRFSGRDGRGPYHLADAAAVIDATKRYAGGTQLAIDWDHAADLAPKGSPAPAAGWIKGLAARSDGIWGLVEWTPRAAAQLRAREYRYLSPVFAFRQDTGEVQRLLRASLTNSPNLELKAVASQGGRMEELLARLRQALGLDEDADADAIVARIAELVEVRESAASRPSPAEFVPIGEVQALARELAETRAGVAREGAELAVSQAITAGKLPPSLRAWGLELCASDRSAFETFVTGMPGTFADLGRNIVGGAPPPRSNRPLGDAELAVCAALGIEPAKFRQSAGE